MSSARSEFYAREKGGDRAYDSDPLDEQLHSTRRSRDDCAAPHRSTRKRTWGGCRWPRAGRSRGNSLSSARSELYAREKGSDRAYDSDPLDEQLQREGVEMIAPRRTALLANAPEEDADGRELDEAKEIH
ncbi:MAG TPA: hypothetical protein VN959_20230 [Mycobacterium sp.]|nr:hypothetical protein [Mycobacterium sp.]